MRSTGLQRFKPDRPVVAAGLALTAVLLLACVVSGGRCGAQLVPASCFAPQIDRHRPRRQAQIALADMIPAGFVSRFDSPSLAGPLRQNCPQLYSSPINQCKKHNFLRSASSFELLCCRSAWRMPAGRHEIFWLPEDDPDFRQDTKHLSARL